MQNDAIGLPRKTGFITEAHFEILKPPLDSWHLNESGGGLDFWFQALIGPTHKSRQTQFDNLVS